MVGERSKQAFERAKRVLVGGVNSPVRAFRAVGGTPYFADRGEGPYLYDIDGHRYIDYLMSWGPLIWGHAHPDIVRAIAETAARGTSFGVPTELETEMAEEIVELVPSVEKVRMVSSGTEATMSAIRLARAATGRTAIVKCIGCYHGHADSFLVKAGSGVAALGLPDSPGVPQSVAERTLTVPYNDADAMEKLFADRGDEIAAVILEPVAGNMGCVLPLPGYLEAVREITRRYGSLLIFDEVITGFRVGLGGAQARFGVLPDLTTFGKVIGAGLPVGAYGGRKDLMALVAPEGPVYQAGTLSGNPLAMAAGLTSLRMLKRAATEGAYDRLESYGRRLVEAFCQTASHCGLPATGHAIGGMFGLFFHSGPIVDFETAKACDQALYADFFHEMLAEGVAFAPAQLESGFMSMVHGEAEIEKTIEAMERAIPRIAARRR